MRKKITVYDILLGVIAACSLFVALPYVIRQFYGLEKVMDILWNIALDLVIVAVVLLVLYALRSLLNRFLS